MKKAATVLLATYVVLALGLSAWFYLQFPIDPGVEPGPTTGFRLKGALIVGFLDAILGVLSLSAIYDTGLRVWRRGRLAGATAGEPQADGTQGVFYGAIHRDGPPLTAPLTGRECLLYRYEVISGGRLYKTTDSTYMFGTGTKYEETGASQVAEGFGLTPSSIETPTGSVKLLTLVAPEFQGDWLTLGQVAESYKAHVATARLQGLTPGAHETIQRSLVKHPRPQIRYDLGSGALPESATSIVEHIVQDGETVAVFGKYSAKLGGIVLDPDDARGTRLYKGPLGSMQKRLGWSAFWFALGSVFWFALAAIGAWAFLTYGPPDIGWLGWTRSIS